MSSTETPYSWNRARAIRWRTSSLGVSLSTFVPEMKSRTKPSRTTPPFPPASPSAAVAAPATAAPRHPRSSGFLDFAADPLPIGHLLGEPPRPLLLLPFGPSAGVPAAEALMTEDLERRQLLPPGRSVDGLPRHLEESGALPERHEVVRRQGMDPGPGLREAPEPTGECRTPAIAHRMRPFTRQAWFGSSVETPPGWQGDFRLRTRRVSVGSGVSG